MNFTWINPNITPFPGRDLYPVVIAPMPTEIHEDQWWLVTRGRYGFIVTDLFMQASIVIKNCKTIKDLQYHLSYAPGDLWEGVDPL